MDVEMKMEVKMVANACPCTHDGHGHVDSSTLDQHLNN